MLTSSDDRVTHPLNNGNESVMPAGEFSDIIYDSTSEIPGARTNGTEEHVN